MMLESGLSMSVLSLQSRKYFSLDSGKNISLPSEFGDVGAVSTWRMLFEPEARGPVVPRHQDVDDDEADGEDGEDPAHGNGHQHLHLTVLVNQELQGVGLLAQTILDMDLSLVES